MLGNDMFTEEEIWESKEVQSRPEHLKILVERYSQIQYQLEELEAEREIIRDEIAVKMTNNQEFVGDYVVRKSKRINFTISLDAARELGAIKTITKEEIDKEKLRMLMEHDINIPHQVTEYIILKTKEEKQC
jgi:hypothetical protein